MSTRDAGAMKKQAKLGALSMAIMIKTLQQGPSTADELAHESGLDKRTVYAYMRAMRKVEAAHISGWDQDSMGRDAFMIYALGPGKDKPRRKRTNSDNVQAYKARQTKNHLQRALSAPLQ